jgi:hypothetical protein
MHLVHHLVYLPLVCTFPFDKRGFLWFGRKKALVLQHEVSDFSMMIPVPYQIVEASIPEVTLWSKERGKPLRHGR